MFSALFFVIFLVLVVLCSIKLIKLDRENPVDKENTYLLHAVVTSCILLAAVSWGFIALIILGLWYKGYITKWYSYLK